MTTPNQPVSALFDTGNETGLESIITTGLSDLVGFGAFQVGSGFGQGTLESGVESLIHGAAPSLVQIFTDLPAFIEQLGSWLSTLPLQALQMMAMYIPGAENVIDEFQTVEGAVAQILAPIKSSVNTILTNVENFVTEDIFGPIQTIVNQILSIVQGLNVTPLNDAVQAFKDWFTGLLGWQSTTDTGIGNLQSVLNQIGDIFAGNVVTPINAAVQDVKDWFNGALATVQSDLSTAKDDVQSTIDNIVNTIEGTAGTVGNAASKVETSIGNFLDQIRQNVLGVSTTGATAATTGTAINGFVGTVQDMQAQINTLRDSFTPVSSAARLLDTPSSVTVYNPDWGPGWTMFGNGTVQRTATDFEWIASGTAARTRYGIYNLAQTSGDIQRGGFVFDGLPEDAFGGTSPGNFCLVRANAAGTTAVYMLVTTAGVSIGPFTGSAMQTPWDTLAISPGAASTWEIIAGDDADPYNFYVLQNGQTVLSYNDAAHTSSVGAGFRYGGQGMVSGSRVILEGSPGKIKIWRLADNVTLGIPDLAISVRCTTGDQGGLNPGLVTVPAGAYDTVDQKSPSMVWDFTNSKVTIPVSGMYSCRVSFGYTAASVCTVAPVLLVNATTQVTGPPFNLNVTAGVVADTFTVWLNAGDTVSPAAWVVISQGPTPPGGHQGDGNWHINGTSLQTTFTVVGIPPKLGT